MNDYIELRIGSYPCNEDLTDLLAAFLADVGYESFVADENGITAYIRKELFDENSIEEILKDFPIEADFKVSHSFIEGKDWNEEWEKNYFKPILVEGKCVVHSSFHKDYPHADFEIVIDPKMAFGTGHHSTTSGMMRHILDIDMQGKSVIDMGTGTGILAILCKMKGAESVVGIDIDQPAIDNAIENAKLNNTEIEFYKGDRNTLSELNEADVFMANINRNIILEDLPYYVSKLKSGGIMLLSGFYEADIPVVMEEAKKHNLNFISEYTDNQWVAIKLQKID